jgi:hypothetical protein
MRLDGDEPDDRTGADDTDWLLAQLANVGMTNSEEPPVEPRVETPTESDAAPEVAPQPRVEQPPAPHSEEVLDWFSLADAPGGTDADEAAWSPPLTIDRPSTPPVAAEMPPSPPVPPAAELSEPAVLPGVTAPPGPVTPTAPFALTWKAGDLDSEDAIREAFRTLSGPASPQPAQQAPQPQAQPAEAPQAEAPQSEAPQPERPPTDPGREPDVSASPGYIPPPVARQSFTPPVHPTAPTTAPAGWGQAPANPAADADYDSELWSALTEPESTSAPRPPRMASGAEPTPRVHPQPSAPQPSAPPPTTAPQPVPTMRMPIPPAFSGPPAPPVEPPPPPHAAIPPVFTGPVNLPPSNPAPVHHPSSFFPLDQHDRQRPAFTSPSPTAAQRQPAEPVDDLLAALAAGSGAARRDDDSPPPRSDWDVQGPRHDEPDISAPESSAPDVPLRDVPAGPTTPVVPVSPVAPMATDPPDVPEPRQPAEEPPSPIAREIAETGYFWNLTPDPSAPDPMAEEDASQSADEPAWSDDADDADDHVAPPFAEAEYEEPALREPVYEQPAHDQPAHDEPAYDERAFAEPAAEEPVPGWSFGDDAAVDRSPEPAAVEHDDDDPLAALFGATSSAPQQPHDPWAGSGDGSGAEGGLGAAFAAARAAPRTPPPHARPPAARAAAPAGAAVAPPRSGGPGSPTPPGGSGDGNRTTRTLLWIAGSLAVLVLLAGLFWVGTLLSGGGAGQQAAPTASEAPTETQEAAPTAPQPVGTHAWNTLFGGECIDPFGSAWDEEFSVVDCANPHAAQLVYRGTFAGDAATPFPGDAELASQMNLLCTAPGVIDLATVAGIADLQVQASFPVTEEQWTEGDRTYYCFAFRSGGEPMLGSIAGPGPAV